MKKVLVTGGAGFIGSNLALELQSSGEAVTVLDNVSSGNRNNLEGFQGDIVEWDVTRLNELGDFDTVYHLASITDTTFPDDDEMIRQNVEGFKEVLKYCEKGAKLVYASSAAVYGNGPAPMKEDQELQPLNAYAVSKVKMDQIKGLFEKDVVGLRYFNVFGPREAYKGRSASMIYHWIQKMNSGETPKLFKEGEQKRDHIYVKDVVEATILASKAKPGIYNVGTGVATTFNKLVEILNKALGKDFEPEYIENPYQKTYQNHTQANTERAEKDLGFKAKYSVGDGIKEYVQYLKHEK